MELAPRRFEAAVKEKLVVALVRAAGKPLHTPERARAFVESELDFAAGQTFGGNSSCVELDTGSREYALCDLGSGGPRLRSLRAQ